MKRRLLTSKEVAEILRTSPGHLANMRMRGEGPVFLRCSRRKILYDSGELEAWLDSHKIKTDHNHCKGDNDEKSFKKSK